MLRFRFLGNFEIVSGGQSVELNSRTAQSLLAFLLINAETKYRRENLAGLFWPDIAEKNARNNLRQLLWQLRKTLGADILEADKLQVGINPSIKFELDTKQLAIIQDTSISLSQRLELLELYRGELLPGFYEDWVLLERERFERIFNAQMALALEGLQSERRWREVLNLAERWLSHRRAIEPAYRALMQAHAALGDSASATAVYQRCVEDLANELGVPPSVETQELLAGITGSGWVAPSRNPYRGLFAFREEDTHLFFGREYFVSRLVDKLAQKQVLALGGASGIGKTSVLFAGLIPVLKNKKWKIVTMRPGSQPLKSLETAMRSLDRKTTKEGNILLLIDQFEELYSLNQEEDSIRDFLKRLLEILATVNNNSKTRPTLLVSVRSDFLGHLLESRHFAEALEGGIVSLGQMNPEELHRAVRNPAEASGCRFEPGLVERIIDDLGEDVSLPLLEFCLTELWEKRQNNNLSHKDYESIGKVKGAVAAYAERVFRSLSLHEQELARKILVQLVQPGDQGPDTKRIATRVELGNENWPLALTMADKRLMVVGRDSNDHEIVELVHETLMTEWHRLRYWIESDREFRIWQEHLRVNLLQWKQSGSDDEALLRGVSLAEAKQHLAQETGFLSADEKTYIVKSGQIQDLRLKQQERTHRNTQLGLVTGLIVALSLAVISAVSFFRSVRSERAALEAYGLSLAANAQQLLESKDPVTALAVALAAYNIADPPPAVADILREAAASPGARRILWANDPASAAYPLVASLALSPDGQYALANTSGSGDLSLISLADGGLERSFVGHSLYVNEIDFSSDGRFAISAADDSSFIVWEVETGQPMRQLKPEGISLAFSANLGPDGSWAITSAAAAGTDVFTIGQSPGILIQWDTLSGEEIRRFEGGHAEIVIDAEISPDGSTMLSSAGLRKMSALIPENGNVVLWDVSSGEILHDFVGIIGSSTKIAYSPDGERALVGSMEGVLYLLDLSTFSVDELSGHSSWISDVTFTLDGRYALASTGDGAIYLWSLDTLELITTLKLHVGEVIDIEIGPDGRYLYSAGLDGQIIEWDLYDADKVLSMSGHSAPVNAAVFTGNGEYILSASDDKSVRVWDAVSGDLLTILRGHADSVLDVAASSDGKFALSASSDGTLRLWDLETKKTIRILEGHQGSVSSVVFAPDGITAVSGSLDNTLIYWNLETGEIIHRLIGNTTPVFSVAVTSDGNFALSGSGDGIIVWELATGAQVQALATNSALYSIGGLAFGVSDEWAVSSSWQGSTGVTLWNMTSRSEIFRFATESAVYDVAVPPGTDYALLAGVNGSLRLFDIDRLTVIRNYFGHRGGEVRSVDISPDGIYAVSGGEDGSIIKWRLRYPDQEDLISWVNENRLIRDLSCEERTFYQIEPLCEENASQGILSISSNNKTSTNPDLTTAPISYAHIGDNSGEVTALSVDVWYYEGSSGEVLDLYALAAEPRNNVSPDQAVEQGLLDTNLVVIAPDGTLLAFNNNLSIQGAAGTTDAGIEGLLLPADGIYRIEVRSAFGQMSGEYILRLHSSETK